MVARSRFVKDRSAGDRGEQALLSLLAAAGLAAGKNPAEDKDGKARYDLWIDLPGRRITAEVKFDRWECRSNNVALEYRNPRSDKPSGITATRADLWVFCLTDGSVWCCRTTDLKRHWRKGPAGLGFVRDMAVCGDGNSSSCLYERVALFDTMFFRLDILERPELTALLEVLTVDTVKNTAII